jgi:acyl carrier protein
MADATILNGLTAVLRDVFDDDTLVATPQLTAHQVNGWDSLGHVRLILEIEKEFHCRFSASEIASLKDVGELAELIAAKSHAA